MIETSEYEPYGGLLNRANDDRAGYTGHVMDAATGLTYMQQRYYDPQIGRFLSVDPVTADAAGGKNFNRYWYGANNPYRFIDPDGREVRASDNYCANKAYQCGDTGGYYSAEAKAARNAEAKAIAKYFGGPLLAAISLMVKIGAPYFRPLQYFPFLSMGGRSFRLLLKLTKESVSQRGQLIAPSWQCAVAVVTQ